MKMVPDANVNIRLSSALLSLDESTQRARPLRYWTRAQQEAVKHRFAELLHAWEADWLPSFQVQQDPEVQVQTALTAESVPEVDAVWFYDDAKSSTPLRTTSAALAAVSRQLFDFDPLALIASRDGSQLSLTVSRAALDDWLDRVRQTLGATALSERGDSNQQQASAAGEWSGALDVSVPWCRGVWHLSMPHAAVGALLGIGASLPTNRTTKPQPLALARALESSRMMVRVALEGAQLNLRQLRDLQVGDVVRLTHRLDSPATLETPDGTQICNAWLGQRSGRIAVELGQAMTSSSPGHLLQSRIHSFNRESS